jgi:hypothetical protein
MSEKDWIVFLEQEKVFLNFLTDNYESMFDGDTINHFDIYTADWGLDQDDIDILKEQYGTEIQKELIGWISQEMKTSALFDQNNWRPFRDSYLIVTMREGYRKLFIYKNFCFQLCIDDECEEECVICSQTHIYHAIHFGLIFHGWLSNEHNKVLPKKQITILSDYSYPEDLWLHRR